MTKRIVAFALLSIILSACGQDQSQSSANTQGAASATRARSAGGSCTANGATHSSGASWACDACGNTCQCKDGIVLTSQISCMK